jgi:presenilin enhancer 2
MVSVDKLTEKERLKVAKLFFFSGWVLLPLLWFYNCLYFFPIIWGSKSPRHQADSEEQVTVNADYLHMKKWVCYSLVSGLLSIIPFVLWYTIYIIQRNDWGFIGDNLSIIIPKGS